MFVPKADSRKKSVYFDKTRIKVDEENRYTITITEADKFITEDIQAEEEFSTKRDDLLHKRNLEYYNEKFKNIKKSKNTFTAINTMILDMHGDGN